MESHGSIKVTKGEVPAGLYEISIEIKDNPYYTSAVDRRTVSVVDYENRTTRVEGNGSIVGSESNFGFIINYGLTKKATPTGSFLMCYEVEEDGVLYKYVIKNNSWAKSSLYLLSAEEAYFESKSTIKKFNMATGKNVYTTGNSSFAVQVVDGDIESHEGDSIAVRIFNGKTVVFEIGTLASKKIAYSGLLIENGGNIMLIR
jgi:hypothetical protein